MQSWNTRDPDNKVPVAYWVLGAALTLYVALFSLRATNNMDEVLHPKPARVLSKAVKATSSGNPLNGLNRAASRRCGLARYRSQ